MTDDEILKFHNGLLKYARKRGHNVEDAEDCASAGVIQVLQGSVPNYSFRYVDWVRSKTKRKTRESYDKNPDPIQVYNDKCTADKRSGPDSEFKFDYYTKHLTFVEQESLRFLIHGYSLFEIAEKIGYLSETGTYSQARVSQLISLIQKKIRDPNGVFSEDDELLDK